MKTIRRIVLKWSRFMDKRKWGKIPYWKRKFPNIKWWKGFVYKLCIKTILFVNKIDPKGNWRDCQLNMFEYGKLADWEKDIIKKAREVK